MGGVVQASTQNRHRFQQRQRNWCSPNFKQAQHTGSITAETMITVEYMVERIARHGRGQTDRSGNKGSEAVPTGSARDDVIQRLAIILRIDQGAADFGEGLQGVAHRTHFVGDLCLANALRSTVEPANDPVVGFDHSVSEHRLPFRPANCQNRKPPVLRQITHPVCIITFALPAQQRYAMSRNADQQILWKIEP